MIFVTNYDEVRDLGVVEPGLAIDLKESMKTGLVSGAGAPPAEYNGIEDLNEIGNVVKDVFDAFVADKQLSNSTEVKSDE